MGRMSTLLTTVWECHHAFVDAEAGIPALLKASAYGTAGQLLCRWRPSGISRVHPTIVLNYVFGWSRFFGSPKNFIKPPDS